MSFLCVSDLLCLCALHATFTIAFVDCDFELTYLFDLWVFVFVGFVRSLPLKLKVGPSF